MLLRSFAPPRVLVVLVAMAASACAHPHQARYHADYFETPEAVQTVQALGLAPASVEGGAAVVMSREAESAVTTLKPTSFTGSVTQIAVPVGRIVSRAAAAAFADVMTEGAIATSDTQAPAGRDYVVTPSVTGFSYRYDFAAGLVTPRVSLGVRVRVEDARGGLILDEAYREDDFGYAGYASAAPPQENANRTLHMLAAKLMAQAASDFAAAVAAAAPVAHAADGAGAAE